MIRVGNTIRHRWVETTAPNVVGSELDPNCFQRSNATSKLLFFREATRIQNSLNPVQARQDVGPDLDQSCFQRLSADEFA